MTPMTLRALHKAIVIALLMNTVAIGAFEIPQLQDFLTSALNFSMTILPAKVVPPQQVPLPAIQENSFVQKTIATERIKNPAAVIPSAPQVSKPAQAAQIQSDSLQKNVAAFVHNTRPIDNATIQLPYRFGIAPVAKNNEMIRWIFRTPNTTYAKPILVIETGPGVEYFQIDKILIKNEGVYFWKTQRFDDTGLNSPFSDETSFVVQSKTPPSPLLLPGTTNPVKKPAAKEIPTNTSRLKIRIKSTTLKKGEPLDITIEPKNTVFNKSDKKININIQIDAADGATKIKRQETIDSVNKILQKKVDETSSLLPGKYILVTNFDQDDVAFAQADGFTVEDNTSSTSPIRVMLWFEIVLGIGLSVVTTYRFLKAQKSRRLVRRS